MSQAAIDQLTSIGSTLLGPFTTQIVQILTHMQSTIDSLNKRIEILEGSPTNNETKTIETETKTMDTEPIITMETTTIPIPVPTDPPSSKSAPVTQKTKSKKKKRKDDNKANKRTRPARNYWKRNVKKEPKTPTKPEHKEDIDTTDDTTNQFGAKKTLRWVFQNDHNVIKQSDNGTAAIKPQFKPGTIRFGKYISKADGDYAAYRFRFDTQSMNRPPSGYAFGLLTKGFNDYTSSNFGQNGCVMVKGNGQYVTSDGLFSSADKENYKHKQIIPQFKQNGMFGAGDIVCMDIDLEQLRLKIWNETRNDGSVFEVDIPNKEVCAMVYMGGSSKRKIVVAEQCAFQYKE